MTAAVVFDAHVHLWESSEEKYRFDPEFGLPPIQAAPLAGLLETMAENGVSRAALIQPGNYGFDASLIADRIAQFPRHFVGLGMVDPRKPDVADRLSHWVKTRHLAGVRVLGSWLGAQYLLQLWQRAAELQVALSFLTGPIDLSQLLAWLNQMPPTPVIIDHFGHRHLEDRAHCQQLLDLAGFPHVYVKMSGLYTLSHLPHPHPDANWLIQAVIDAFGPDRLMWASDYPYIVDTCGYAACLDFFHFHLPNTTQEDRDWICGKTAQKIWPESVWFHGF